MNFNEALAWRYAVKKFNPNKKLAENQINQILEAANLSATSLGLQTFKILLIENPEIKKKLVPACFNQLQIESCSHLIILATESKIDKEFVSQRMAHFEKMRNLSPGSLKDYEQMANGFISNLNEEDTQIWAQKQTYIVLGKLMAACAIMEIDSCPMEGFIQTQVDEVLGLKDKGLSAAVLLPIGFRAEDDIFQNQKKVRMPLEKMVIKF